jgi:phosphatidylserine/phosphatidylglycerophosphate/cardiolipin synthase-like enzyme
MRQRKQQSGVTVNAIAGTHVVILGFDLDANARKNCLGFAVQRYDKTEDEKYWMKGMKTFKSGPALGPGGEISTHDQPLQTFQWSDYSAKPDHDYEYTVIPMYGGPGNLTDGPEVTVKVSTESETGDTHSVFFNRGAVASQEYARRFLNQAPDKVGEPAYEWLSRGLREAMIAFIERAKNSDYELFGAIYEFQWHEVLEALRDAAKAGAKVQILYDGIKGATGPLKKNKKAISNIKIEKLCHARSIGKIMHNKFFVLVKNKKPVAVWSGSTNITENGLFGHLNCGHLVEDSTIAQAYLDYWHELRDCTNLNDEKTWMASNNAAPPEIWGHPIANWTDDVTAVFSPRKGLEVLQAYADISAKAQKALFMTLAFGMHKSFQKVYEQNDGVLRFALMEKEGNGRGLAQGKIDIRRIRRLPNVVVAIGHYITVNSFDRWLKERSKIIPDANVLWVHTKFMLLDPLGANPVVITGSANFSEASTNANNENMMVIRNNQRVADIYLGEFMRVYSHHAFREAVAIAKENGEDWNPSYLDDTDQWQKDYYSSGNQRCYRREYFRG